MLAPKEQRRDARTSAFYTALGPEFEPRGGLASPLTDREDRTRRDLRARAYLRRKGAK